MHLKIHDGFQMNLNKPVIVGILNITPDSFSDGGMYLNPETAVEAALHMVEAGADMIDIGGESTRPGANRVDAQKQIERVVPVIAAISQRLDVLISIDTTLAEVAEAGLDAGASLVNDISAAEEDPQMAALIAERQVPIILMHKQGSPSDMQEDPQYVNVVEQVSQYLLHRASQLMDQGVDGGQIVLDPGIGFGKKLEHNLALLRNLHTFVESGFPVMLGASRKSFIHHMLDVPDPLDRDAGTCATTAMGVQQGVQMFRVHHVAANRQAADLAHAITQQAYIAEE